MSSLRRTVITQLLPGLKELLAQFLRCALIHARPLEAANGLLKSLYPLTGCDADN